MKTKPKRCPKCKKATFTDISSEPQQINHFTIRSFTGIMCSSCSWVKKDYVFKDIEEKKKG